MTEAAAPPLSTPVSLFMFNRPELTERVFDAIAAARPPVLLLVGDGPRDGHPDDRERCEQARAVVDRVDWPCRVSTAFADRNLGIRARVTSGLDWVFDQVEEAIVLEDDCLPDSTFFRFCQELLDRYRRDERVMMVSGSNLASHRLDTPYSYEFSKWGASWGWATWRRAWHLNDHAMEAWPGCRDSGWLKRHVPDRRERQYWASQFEATYAGRIDTWDYQWLLSRWLHGGVSVVPSENLVSNIGFGEDGTHCLDVDNPLSGLPARKMSFPLVHPPAVAADSDLDRLIRQAVFKPAPISREIRNFIARTRRRATANLARSSPGAPA